MSVSRTGSGGGRENKLRVKGCQPAVSRRRKEEKKTSAVAGLLPTEQAKEGTIYMRHKVLWTTPILAGQNQ